MICECEFDRLKSPNDSSLTCDNYCVFGLCSQIEIDTKYQNQICGLCGNFDSISNDFVINGKILFS